MFSHRNGHVLYWRGSSDSSHKEKNGIRSPTKMEFVTINGIFRSFEFLGVPPLTPVESVDCVWSKKTLKSGWYASTMMTLLGRGPTRGNNCVTTDGVMGAG